LMQRKDNNGWTGYGQRPSITRLWWHL